MNLTDISTQLLFTTLRLWAEDADGTTRSGTAFIYNIPIPSKPGHSIPVLLTNGSVVRGARRGLLELTGREGDAPARDQPVRVELTQEQLGQYSSQELDVALILLGPVLNQLEQSGRPVFFRAITPEMVPDQEATSDISALEEIVFIGHPTALAGGSHGGPLFRRGITATPFWGDFQDRPEFLMDAGILPGSWGSPVFIFNQGAYATRNGMVVGRRVLFLGMVLPPMGREDGGTDAFAGLGRVVKSTAIKAFIDSSLKAVVKSA